MYKILGEEDIFSPLYGVGEVDKTLVMYSIIIADIAPMTPGNLTHFNWPRLLRNKPTYRVLLQDLSYDGLYMHENRKTRRMLHFR